MNGRGCKESIERMSRQFARAREAEETVVASGTSRFYQRRSAITSGIVVSNEKQTDPKIDSRIDEYGHFRREERRAGITPFKVLFPIGVVLFVGFWTWALFFASKTPSTRSRIRPGPSEPRRFVRRSKPSCDLWNC